MELLDFLSQSFDHASKIVAGVSADQLSEKTPCTEWDVRALLVHMTGGMVNIGRGARGEELLADMNAYPLDADFGAQYRREAERTLESWHERGLAGQVDIGAGPMPASFAASINLVDSATHSWDLARATGQDAELPDDLASAVLGTARGFVDDGLRRFAGIDPAIPVDSDATPTARLVAFMGRVP
jgi:uncharacterized protein (TIGR03086 family)